MRRVARTFLASLIVALTLCVCGTVAHADPIPSGYEGEKNPRHSVVVVHTEVYIDDTLSYWGQGTGFFVGKQGEDPVYLITNHHVVDDYIEYGQGEVVFREGEDGAEHSVQVFIKVLFDSNDAEEAKLVDYSDIRDLALLKLEEPTNKRVPLIVGETDQSMVGNEKVRCVGYPGIVDRSTIAPNKKFGEKNASIWEGTVSNLYAMSGTGTKVIATDANIFHGNSGGPMVDTHGLVIGVNSWGYETLNGEYHEGVNYAVDISEVEQMLRSQSVEYERTSFEERDASAAPPATTGSTEGQGTDGQGTGGEMPLTPPVRDEKPVNITLIVVVAACAVAAIAAVVVILVMRGKKQAAATASAAQSATASAAQPAPTNAMGVSQPPAQPAPQSQRNADDSGFRVQGMDGAMGGKRVYIPVGRRLRIGVDAESCGITLPQGTPGVSRVHCELWVEGNGVFLNDLGSRFGTFVDPGIRLNPNNPVRLQENTAVWLGDQSQKFMVVRK